MQPETPTESTWLTVEAIPDFSGEDAINRVVFTLGGKVVELRFGGTEWFMHVDGEILNVASFRDTDWCKRPFTSREEAEAMACACYVFGGLWQSQANCRATLEKLLNPKRRIGTNAWAFPVETKKGNIQ